jgi:hypothetical protein
LTAFAHIQYEHHGTELAALPHRGEHVARAQQHLTQLTAGLLAEAASVGTIRDDIPPAELANYSLHALTAASGLQSAAAVHRLISATLAGLQPQT